MILTHDPILKKVESGEIKIEPFEEKCVGPASYDLHLGNKFRTFKEAKEVFQVTESADFEKVTELVDVSDSFLLLPGQTVHAITKERIELSDNICGWLEGRSRYGRLGLMIHITAGFIQPGSTGFQVLEMNNAGPMPLSLSPGLAICQIIFEETVGHALYRGKFHDQKKP